MHRLVLPLTFWRDHDERDLPSGEVIRYVGKNRVEIECDDATLDEIENDAQHYSDCASWTRPVDNFMIGLQRSAVSTVRRIARHKAGGQKYLRAVV